VPAAHRKTTCFDYIVIGAGSAGCCVAARLAADSGTSVALLEAGGRYRRILDIPLVGLWAWRRRPHRFCWQDWTIPQPALEGRRVWWPAGRIVGGGSAINAMMYSRGHPASFDRWRCHGGPEWSYESLLPYFRRAEDQERGASRDHGTGGPIAVSDGRCLADLTRAFVEGCIEAGVPPAGDFNAAGAEGAGIGQVMQRDGRRAAVVEYLLRTAGGPAVSLHLHARATRLLIEGRRAAGVEYVTGGRTRQLRARREVIVSAGAVRSPHLLMLSGIGPADALRQAGIEVLADLPGVGANLRDHVRIPVIFRWAGRRPTRPSRLAIAAVDYLTRRRGLLTSNVCDAVAVVRLHPADPVPSVRIVCQWRIWPEEAIPHVDFEVVAIDPRSTGRLSVVSRDPLAAPAVDPGYLSDPDDVRTLVSGIARAREIARSPSCRRGGIEEERAPGCAPLDSYVRRTADSAYHAVGTCRMGRDPLAVVDPSLRVHGIDGLRVVDASVMPTTVTGNAQAAVVAIAERAADVIRSSGGSARPDED
jgi:choline dehydrogenase-like flavoprotein